jgi:ryanodine receptor 1
MVMSLLGHYNNFFFAAHLLDIAMGVKTLRTILSSVTHNGKQVCGGPGRGQHDQCGRDRRERAGRRAVPGCLWAGGPVREGLGADPSMPSCQLVMTVGLLAVVVYLYTVVAFNFFRKFYNKSEDEDEPDMKCDDMMTVSPSPSTQG